MYFIKRILPVTLAMMLSAQVCFADEDIYLLNKNYLDDISNVMDNIFKFDVGDFAADVDDDTKDNETSPYADKIDLVCALGFMQKTKSGEFLENAKLTTDEFIRVIANLHLNRSELSEYTDARTVKFETAVSSILSVLGYDVYLPLYDTEKEWALTYASKLNLFDGLNYAPEKEITRGEFAALLYNSFDANMMSVEYASGNVNEKETTILEKTHNIYKKSGVLNGLDGLNLYQNSQPQEGYIQVERMNLEINTVEVSPDLFAKRVTVYYKEDEDKGQNVLLYIAQESASNAVVVNSEDIVELQGDYVHYDDGSKVKKIKLADNCKIMYNGTLKSNYAFIDDMAEKYGGRVTFSKSEKNGDYDIIVAKMYSDFVVASINSEKRRLSFKYDAKYDNQSNIILDDDATICIDYNGQISHDLSEISTNTVISFFVNESGNYAEFKLSDKAEEGIISSLADDNKVEMNGEEYVISDTYLKCSEQDDKKKIKTGTSGEFYFTYDDRIAGCKLSDENHYAYLEKAYMDDDGEKAILRLFTDDNKWETLTLNDKVLLDGVSKDAVAVHNYIKAENLAETLVTYRTNSSGIKALNTEKGKVKLDYTHTVKLDWRLGVSIPGADDAAYQIAYAIRDNTIVFKIPRDKTKKSDYHAFYGNTNFYSGEKFVFNFYDSDDFYVAGATVAQAYDSASVSTIEGRHYAMYLTSVQQTVNSDDEPEYIVKGHYAKNMGGAKTVFQMDETYKVKEDIFEDLNLEKGKFYNMVIEDGYVSNAELWFDPDQKGDTWKQEGDGTASFPYIAIGYIKSYDPTTHMIMISMDTDDGEHREYARYMPGNAWLLDGKDVEALDISELISGDRAFVYTVRDEAPIVLIVRK